MVVVFVRFASAISPIAAVYVAVACDAVLVPAAANETTAANGDQVRLPRPATHQRNRTQRPDAGLQALITTLQEGWVAVVADSAGFYGLITRFDLLNYLRKTLA